MRTLVVLNVLLLTMTGCGPSEADISLAGEKIRALDLERQMKDMQQESCLSVVDFKTEDEVLVDGRGGDTKKAQRIREQLYEGLPICIEWTKTTADLAGLERDAKKFCDEHRTACETYRRRGEKLKKPGRLSSSPS